LCHNKSVKSIISVVVVCGVLYLLMWPQLQNREYISVAPPVLQVEYFGFAITDCYYDDTTTSKIETDYLDEILTFSNVAHLCAFSPEQSVSMQLEYYEQVDLQALLYVEFILFDHDKTTERSGVQLSLREDYQSRWRTFAANTQLDSHADQILAISIVDEPYWNNLTFSELREVSEFLVSEHPDIKQNVVFAAPTIVDPEVVSVDIPSTIAYIGFDKYTTFSPLEDQDYLRDFDLLTSAMEANQQMIIIFESMWQPLYKKHGLPRSDVSRMIIEYYEFASQHPHVVGLIGYPWPNDFDGEGVVGARGLSELYPLYQAMYKKISK